MKTLSGKENYSEVPEVIVWDCGISASANGNSLSQKSTGCDFSSDKGKRKENEYVL